jgi:AraC-like DNA-binding protein
MPRHPRLLADFVTPPEALARAPAALSAIFHHLVVMKGDADLAFRVRLALVGDLAFSRSEASGHIDLKWIDPDLSVRSGYQWLVISSSGAALANGANATVATHEAALIDGATWPDRLRLIGSSRTLMVMIPSRLLPIDCRGSNRIASDRGCGAVLAAMARAIEMQGHLSHDVSLEAAVAPFIALTIQAFAAAAAGPQPGEPLARLGRVIDHIELHLDDPDLSPTSVARDCGLSVRQLHRLFQPADETFSMLVRRLRMERATNLLQHGKQSIGEIARLCGFAEPAYFATIFKSVYAVSPKAWRNRHRRAGILNDSKADRRIDQQAGDFLLQMGNRQ